MRLAARRPRLVQLLAIGAGSVFFAGCGTTVKTPAPNGNASGATGVNSAAGSGESNSGLAGSLGTSSGGTGGSSSSSGGSGTVTIPTAASDGASVQGGATHLQAPGYAGTSGGTRQAPIQIGFIVTNVSNAAQFGINAGQTFTDQQLYQALVNATNASGGIDGRRIDPIFAVTDTASANWNTDFQAACANFTQDHHVAAVLGYIFVFLNTFETCLAKAGVPHLYGGYQPGDTTDQQQYPALVATTNPTGDVHYRVGFSGAITTGLLTPKNKLGVIVDSCANDDQAFSRAGAPYLKAEHITYETFDVGCSAGASQDGTAVSELQSAELHFRADGVDTVFVEGVPALLFAEDAESQHWHPSYLMTDAGAAYENNVPNDQLANFHGFGWMPSVDVDPSHQPYPWNASQKRCLDMLVSQGLRPSGYNDYMEAFTTCDGLFLYAAALAADGNQTSTGPVVSALASVIGKTLLSSTYDGAGRYVAAQHGGPAVWRQWGWVTACSCFEYLGPVHPIG